MNILFFCFHGKEYSKNQLTQQLILAHDIVAFQNIYIYIYFFCNLGFFILFFLFTIIILFQFFYFEGIVFYFCIHIFQYFMYKYFKNNRDIFPNTDVQTLDTHPTPPTAATYGTKLWLMIQEVVMFFIFPSYESSLYLTALEAIYSTTNPKTGLYFPTKSQEREKKNY